MGRLHKGDERCEHEGFVVGYVPADWQPQPRQVDIGAVRPVAVLEQHYTDRSWLRELGPQQLENDCDIYGICVIGYGCACGWRSPYYYEADKPHEWSPRIMHVPEQLETRLAERYWQPHVEATLRRREQIARGYSTASALRLELELPQRAAADLLAFLDSLGNSDLDRIMRHLGSERADSANYALGELEQALRLALAEAHR